MKKVILFVTLMVASFATKSQEVNPKTVLDKMSTVYKAMEGYEISFVQKVISDAEVIDRLNGKASVSKEKFVVKFQEQLIYCNGPILWTYIVESQELTISNFDPEEGQIDPSNIYDIYKDGFTYEYKRQDTLNGEAVHVIELISTDEDSDFTNIIMYVNQQNSYLKGWDLIDYAGAKTAFEVTGFTPNKSFSETFFEFNYDANPVQHEEDLRY